MPLTGDWALGNRGLLGTKITLLGGMDNPGSNLSPALVQGARIAVGIRGSEGTACAKKTHRRSKNRRCRQASGGSA